MKDGLVVDKLNWSEWRPLLPQVVSEFVPDLPGIYEIKTDREFGRLNGSSRIVYIGSAARNTPSLRKRLLGRISNGSLAEKRLWEHERNLEFRFATMSDGQTAERMEAERQIDYERQHWELPPGNGAFPRRYFRP